jgi:hypothetical protein
MVNTIVVNGSNVDSGNTSRYTFRFTNSQTFVGQQIALTGLNIYYSWFNVSASNVNNTFSYVWPVGPVTVDVVVPDGYYSVSELNSYLQFVMIQNNHYLMDAGGDNVYYLELVENPSLYAVQFNSYPVPTALPGGYSAPAGWSGYPAVASTPQLVVPNTNFQYLIGFTPGTYPAAVQATNYSATSDTTPQVSPVSSVLVSCSLVHSGISSPDDIIFGFSPSGTAFGSIISPTISSLVWNTLRDGTYNEMTLTFLDQNYNFLPITDTNLTVLLAIKDREELSF